MLALLLLGAIFLFSKSKAPGKTKHSPSSLVKNVRSSYTKEQVSKHNTRKDCWIIVKDKVYDVTPYVEEHPGGDAILNNAGHDSTEGFYGPQHATRVFDMVDEFYIGGSTNQQDRFRCHISYCKKQLRRSSQVPIRWQWQSFQFIDGVDTRQVSGNFVDDSTKYIFSEDMLNTVTRQLKGLSSPGMCIQAMFFLANIAAENDSHTDAVIDCVLLASPDLGISTSTTHGLGKNIYLGVDYGSLCKICGDLGIKHCIKSSHSLCMC